MSGQIGYRAGCIGHAGVSNEYGSWSAYFEDREGRLLATPSSEPQQPDAIHVTAADDMGANMYVDSQLAFSDEAAERLRADRDAHVPESNISVISEDRLARLSRLCTDCSVVQGDCPMLLQLLNERPDVQLVTQ
jgi:hypothetical protein